MKTVGVYIENEAELSRITVRLTAAGVGVYVKPLTGGRWGGCWFLTLPATVENLELLADLVEESEG